MTAAALLNAKFDREELFQERERATSLHVSRKDIAFANVSPECVRIEITVHNLGEYRSAPTVAALMAAPL